MMLLRGRGASFQLATNNFNKTLALCNQAPLFAFSTGITKANSAESLAVVNEKLENNIFATPSRDSPNAEQLKDGAVQRASVTIPKEQYSNVSTNPDGVGVYKRAELNSRASETGNIHSNPWDTQKYRYKVARIYMP